MRKGLLKSFGLILLIGIAGSTIYAQDVLKSTQSSPDQIVAARKLAMRAIAANVGDLNKKINSGDIKGVATNATNISALATFLPLVFKERYPAVYPVKGSKYYYRSEIPDVETAFKDLKARADALGKSAMAADRAGVEAASKKLLGSCGGCHRAARSEY